MAHAHQGCSFVEIYQDCNIFNHGAFDEFALKANRTENTVVLEEGKPLLYGLQQGKGFAFRKGSMSPSFGTTARNSINMITSNLNSAMRLASLSFPAHPVPFRRSSYQKPRRNDFYFRARS